MNIKESVEKRIEGDGKELKRRKEIWGKIADAYDKRGEESIKDVLNGYSNCITEEFDKLIEKLEESLKGGGGI